MVFLFIIQPIQIRANEKKDEKILTIEYVMEEGQKHSHEVLYYTHRWLMLHYQKEDTKDTLNNIKEPRLPSLELLPVTREELLAAYPHYDQLTDEEKQEIDRIIDIQIQINQSLNMILLANHQNTSSQLKELEKEIAEKKRELQQIIKEIDIEQGITKINEQEIKEFIQYYLAKRYIDILLYDEQITFLEKGIQFLKDDVKRVELSLSIGYASKEELKKVKQQLSSKERELLNLKKSRQLLEKQLMIDLNISLTQKVMFQPVNISVMRKIEHPKNMDNIIENSFVYQKNKKNLEIAIYKKEQASGNNEKQQMEQNVKMVEAQLNTTKQKLKKLLLERYNYFELLYEKCEGLNNDYEQALLDKEHYEKQLQIGLISKHEYNSLIMKLDEIIKNYRLAKLEYYLAGIEEKQIHRGYIPTDN